MPALSSSAASYTHPGRRKSNQDAVVVRRLGNGAELVAVADGMGGHSAGEVASSMALEVLIAELEGGAGLDAAVAAANATLYEQAQGRSEWQGMGTTLVVLLRTDDSFQIANVGDSRAYLIDGNTVQQITEDHSYVAEAIRSGSISAAEAERSPWRNALTRALGTDGGVEVDLFGPFSTRSPQAVLLCSDGLHKVVAPELIREYVLSTNDLATAVEALAALAYRRGSDDNITVAAVEFDPLHRRPPTVTLPLPIQLQGGSRGSSGRPKNGARNGTSTQPQAGAAVREREHAGRKLRRRWPRASYLLALFVLLSAAAVVFAWLSA